MINTQFFKFQGTFLKRDGEKYEGQWDNGKMNGKGNSILKN